MNTLDKAIRNCDIDFEKGNYFILKYGKYSETILSEGEAMHKFKKAKEQFGRDMVLDLVKVNNGLTQSGLSLILISCLIRWKILSKEWKYGLQENYG